MPFAADVADLLLDPWRSGITSRALLEVLLIGLAAGPLGCWVVLFGLSYGAESLTHAMFPGLVIAALAGFPLDARRRTAESLIAAPAVALAGRLPTIGADTAIAVVVTSLVGAGALLALAPESPAGVQELLFGDVLGVSSGELLLAAALVVVVLAALRARARKAAGGRLRPRRTPPPSAPARAPRTRCCCCSSARSRSSPCRRSGPCWCSRCWSGRQRRRASSTRSAAPA